MHPSHELILNLPEHDHHNFVTFLHDEVTGMEAFVAIHRRNPQAPSFGATRMWQYATDTEALRDALRLSRLMSYKAALAGLPCGGAKGVIIAREDKDRTAILDSYADKISLLKDSFITGTDMGIEQSDLAVMKERTPNIIGFNDNSTEFTVLGVKCAIQCALKHTFGSDSLSGRTCAIQGLGKIGSGLLDAIVAGGGKAIVCDIYQDAVDRAKAKHPDIKVVPSAEIHLQTVDVFSPCAVGGAINSTNVSALGCKIVAGGANNQLESEEMGDTLFQMGILYAPDYVVNAGGLIAVFDEYEHPDYDRARVQSKVDKIDGRLSDIIAKSRAGNRPTNRIANEYAEQTFNSYA